MHETDAVRSAVAELTVTDKHSRLQLTEVTDEITLGQVEELNPVFIVF